MKKLLRKITPKKSADNQSPSRITNETVAEHREKILAGGRRFKYPVQVAKHRLAIVSIVIGVLAIVLLVILAWQQLYVAQNTSKFFYRITEIIPVSVAEVDGAKVRYSSYLKKYRSSIFYLQQQNSINLNSVDGKRQSDFIKQREMDSAQKDAYALKIAGQKNISVTDKEVEDFISKDIARKNISLEAYEKTVLNSFYDWTLGDYRAVVKTELLKRKVRFAVDMAAKEKASDIYSRAVSNPDFATLAKEQSDDEATKVNGGEIGTVSVDNDDANGVIAAARALEPGKVSAPVQGTDGYYIVKLSTKTATSVTYSMIKVKLSKFDNDFSALRENGKIKEYIDIKRD